MKGNIAYRQNRKEISGAWACQAIQRILTASGIRLLGVICCMLLHALYLNARGNLYRGVITVDYLRCSGVVQPGNLDVSIPELAWQIAAAPGIDNVLQTGYQIQVASDSGKLKTGDGDLWDSKKVNSDQQFNVAYKGLLLKSFQKVYWRVRVWTTRGASDWSRISCWRMGMLRLSDRKGQWIGYDHPLAGDTIAKFPRLSARYLRKEFVAQKKIRAAIAYVSGLGLYELHINGQKAGDAVLAPAPTDYTKTVLYNAVDVTGLIRNGDNAIGVVLGSGRFFAMRQHYKPWKWRTFGFPKLYFQLQIEYEDGSIQNVVSDNSWRISAGGPIRNNNEYDGETYDARMELTGWDGPNYNSSRDQWKPVELVDAPAGKWTAQLNPPMKVMQRLKPQSILPAAGGGFILDMGQNMAGWLQMELNGTGHEGDTVQLVFAESLEKSENGYQLYRANLRDARSTDYYVIKGAEKEKWHPVFTYHGFRYVKVTGYPAKIEDSRDNRGLLNAFAGEVVYDALLENGEFSCSDRTINQIYHNAVWGIKSNYKGMPVDCPQRNERQPWLGDRTTGAYGESFAFNNQLLYDKWVGDIKDAQLVTGSIPDVAPNFWMYYKDDVTWPSTYLTVGDMLYHQFGDLRIIQKTYASMKFWMEYMQQKYLKNGLMDRDSYGDWCVPPDSLKVIHSRNPAKITDGGLIATATFYHDLQLMTRFAVLAGSSADTSNYKTVASQIKLAFQKRYFNRQAGYYGNNTVTANLLPLAFGIVDSADELRVFNQIVHTTTHIYNNHISSGVIGIQWFLRILSRYGRNDLAVRIAGAKTYPGWGYMVSKGATTIWELWNGNTANPAMNSQNHVMLLGDLLIWLYEDQAGIKSDNGLVGFKKIQFAPYFDGPLDSVSAAFHSGYGWIKSHWIKRNGLLNWEVEIPPGSTAAVHLPVKLKEVKLDGKAVKGLENGGNGQLELGSGTYHIDGKLLNVQ